MEVYSLEEDDCSQLFITQTSPKRTENGLVLGDPMDFVSPCVSLVSKVDGAMNVYSDISDDDMETVPCSQVAKNENADDERSVYYYEHVN